MGGMVFDNITKVYDGDVVAVSDFSLKVAEGEFLVIVGPSGCGKSTLLRMVAGLEDITKGRLYFGDRLINGVHPKDRDIAMVFQNYALYPHKNVYDNMAFGLKLKRMPGMMIDGRVNEAARLLSLEELLERKPATLSGGQRQRVALGRSIVRKAGVFLFDEPLSNLDAKLRASMRTEINALHKRLGKTFIYVTHDQLEAMTLGTLIAVMKEGRLQQAGDPHTLYENPANLFVAEFIGTPKMNVCAGTLKDGKVKFSGMEIPLSYEQSARLKAHPEDVYIGFRPGSGMRLKRPGDGYVFCARAEVIENLGYEKIIYVTMPGGKDGAQNKEAVITAPAASSVNRGDNVEVAIDPSDMYLFDKNTEVSVMNRTKRIYTENG